MCVWVCLCPGGLGMSTATLGGGTEGHVRSETLDRSTSSMMALSEEGVRLERQSEQAIKVSECRIHHLLLLDHTCIHLLVLG